MLTDDVELTVPDLYSNGHWSMKNNAFISHQILRSKPCLCGTRRMRYDKGGHPTFHGQLKEVHKGGYMYLYHTLVTGWCLSTITVDMGGASVPLALLRAPLPRPESVRAVIFVFNTLDGLVFMAVCNIIVFLLWSFTVHSFTVLRVTRLDIAIVSLQGRDTDSNWYTDLPKHYKTTNEPSFFLRLFIKLDFYVLLKPGFIGDLS